MARKPRRKARIGGVAGILVLAVTIFCTLLSMEDKGESDILATSVLSLELPSELTNAVDSLLNSTTAANDAAPVSSSLPDAKLEVHFLDVGQAESILIKGPETNVLIDAAENDQGDEVLDYLAQAGVEQLDIAIGTHPHSDHIGGLDTVLDGIATDTVILPVIPEDITPTTRTYRDVLETIEQQNLTVVAAEPGDVYDLGDGAELQILGPLNDYDDLNDMSVVCRLDYGNTSFLFTGDACTDSEDDILQSGANVKVDVLNVGHHGSSTSSSETWIQTVAPRVAVISCGLDNSYGHPHREVMERLNALDDTRILRTDQNGAIVVASDGQQLGVSSER